MLSGKPHNLYALLGLKRLLNVKKDKCDDGQAAGQAGERLHEDMGECSRCDDGAMTFLMEMSLVMFRDWSWLLCV